jgi:hypothetical protein
MKLAAALLATLAIVYVVVVARPAPAWEDRAARSRGDWRESLNNWLAPDFDYTGVTGCVDKTSRVFHSAPVCAAQIAKTASKNCDYRFLKLTFSGAEAVVDFNTAAGDTCGMPSRSVTLRVSAPETTVVIPPAGGTLTIKCAPPSPSCSVRGR